MSLVSIWIIIIFRYRDLMECSKSGRLHNLAPPLPFQCILTGTSSGWRTRRTVESPTMQTVVGPNQINILRQNCKLQLFPKRQCTWADIRKNCLWTPCNDPNLECATKEPLMQKQMLMPQSETNGFGSFTLHILVVLVWPQHWIESRPIKMTKDPGVPGASWRKHAMLGQD